MPDTTSRTPGRVTSPAAARLLVVLAVASCALIYSSAFFDSSVSGAASIVGGVVWFPVYVLLRRCVQEAADLPDDRLDEREVALRDRCYLVAYRLIGATISLSLVLAVTDDAADGTVVRSWNGPWAALLLLSAVLPSAVLANAQRRTD